MVATLSVMLLETILGYVKNMGLCEGKGPRIWLDLRLWQELSIIYTRNVSKKTLLTNPADFFF